MRGNLVVAALLAVTPLAHGQQGGAGVQTNQSLSDVVLQLQQLQREVQQLRGELEMQAHAMDAMNKRQRELYLDIDRRLGAAGGQPPPTEEPQHRASPPQAAPPSESVAVVETKEPPPPAAVVPPGDPAEEQARYQKAFELLREGSYPESITAFRDFLRRYPTGAYADNAQYWLGEASYVTRDFTTALADFTAVVNDHPGSAKVPDSLLKIGYIHYEQRDWKKARQTLEQLRGEYPESTPARLAQKRLERMRKEGR